MRVIVGLFLAGLAQGGALSTPDAKAAVASVAPKEAVKAKPLVADKVKGHVELSAEQKKAMHWGCVAACKPSPIESKCVTACETAMYKCIDETGPNEDEKDTKKCQDKVLAHYKETKGVDKKEEKKAEKGGEAKKEEKKAEKKAKAFLQVVHEDDTADDDMEGSAVENGLEEDAEQEAEDAAAEASDDEMSTGASDEAALDDVEDTSADVEADEDILNEDQESFVQVSKKNIDDDNAEAAEMAKMEDETDKLEGEDSDDSATSGSEEGEDGDEESFIQTKSEWKPEPCDELEPGVPCKKLYQHPQGSTVVMPCPVEGQTNAESCSAYFGNKADGEQCPQITCPKALGVTMKLTCGGGCCPSCWAPDHVIKLDRHTTVNDAAVVDPAPQAPGTCSGVKCFELNCAAGFTKGHVNGDCCYSCVQGR